MIVFIGGLALGLVLLGVGVFAGMALADWLTGYRNRVLDARAAELQAEWEAIEAIQRMHAASFDARRVMRGLAARYSRREPSR